MRKSVLKKQAQRCLEENSDFGRLRLPGGEWQIHRKRADGLLEILNDPDRFLRNSRLMKEGRSATVGAGNGLVLKRYNFRKPLSMLKDLVRPSRAASAFLKAYHLELCGIATAEVVAMASRREWIFCRRSYLLMKEVSGARHLGIWRDSKMAGIRAVAQFLGRLHEEGFRHRDLKETNLLFDDHQRLHLIDLEGLSFVGSVSPEVARADLSRLEKGLARDLTRADRRRFIHIYCRTRNLLPRKIFTLA